MRCPSPLLGGAVLMHLTALLAGCGSDSTFVPPPATATTVAVFSEAEYGAGIIPALTAERKLLVTLESPGSSGHAGDTSGIGYDEFKVTLKNPTVLDLCFRVPNGAHTLSIFDLAGTKLGSMTSQPLAHDCATDGVAPVTVPAGTYLVRIDHDGRDPAPQALQVSLNITGKKASAAARTVAAAAPADQGTLDVTALPVYNAATDYPTPGTLVTYKDVTSIYYNGWDAPPGACPVQADCPVTFQGYLWNKYDPGVKHEFAYYDYPSLRASSPAVRTCTASDYGIPAARQAVFQNLTSGAPAGGFTASDKEALAREYMLPCLPDLTAAIPDNVATVKRVLPLATWNALAGQMYAGDKVRKYFDAAYNYLPWPAEQGMAANSYSNFLAAVARYPYFCGEQGYFSTVDEACKRELAALFAHAAQETGNTDPKQSFYWLREYGWVNGTSYFKDGCAPPFDCTTNGWARYYGRGPTQLTYYFNYAGFSAAYYNGDYNFLLRWPDLVAYDGKLFFESVIWFMMTNQPPKPSIHDILVGRYRPDASCANSSAPGCYGVQYDATTGVKSNFNLTIEVVNGGPECRCPAGSISASCAVTNDQASGNRTASYSSMLTLLGATLTAAEQSTVAGCGYIAHSLADPAVSIFTSDKLKPGLNTAIDLAGASCQAQASGGTATVSVTAPGIVGACRSK